MIRAANAAEGRELIRQFDPDVVTLDVEMPGMNGLDFLEKIMTLRPTPVIVVSGSTQEGSDVTARALALGAVAVEHGHGVVVAFESDGDAIRAAATRLGATSDTARLDAELLAAHLLGAGVVRRVGAHAAHGGGAIGVAVGAQAVLQRVQRLGDAEIEQLDLAVLVHQHVAGFQVAVHQQVTVGIGHGIGQLCLAERGADTDAQQPARGGLGVHSAASGPFGRLCRVCQHRPAAYRARSEHGRGVADF